METSEQVPDSGTAEHTVTQRDIELLPVLSDGIKIVSENSGVSTKGLAGILIATVCVGFLASVIAIIASSSNISFAVTTSLASRSVPSGVPPISAFTVGHRQETGFIRVYFDDISSKLYVEVTPAMLADQTGILLSTSISNGLGIVNLFIDRGLINSADTAPAVVRFEAGASNNVLLVQQNTRFVSSVDTEPAWRAVRESFPVSVLASLSIVARNADGTVLVDLTEFLIARQTNELAQRLASQGAYVFDRSRSVLVPAGLRVYDDNANFETRLTFALTRAPAGSAVSDVAPDVSFVTLALHHAFMRLPPLDGTFRPRAYDPRAGVYALSHVDLTAPIEVGSDWTQRSALRFRLRYAEGATKPGPVEQPIVFYVDSSIPEPVRSAVVEGAGWWRTAFEAAGYQNAFRVELLPADADPDHLQRNVIEWIHRQARGYSVGQSLVDPRTGEILRAHVSLGSLRARQDFVLAQGLFAAYDSNNAASKLDEMRALVLARIRQLAAHEVGHTLGLKHNFAASTNNRASVMDYPVPLLSLDADGTINGTRAYAVGVGEWDTFAVRYLYEDFGSGEQERAALQALVAAARQRGLRYVTDEDTDSGSQPYGMRWDEGESTLAALDTALAVRARALSRISLQSIPAGSPLASLQLVFVPIYLHHRYTAEMAIKMLGGVDYAYMLNDLVVDPQLSDPAYNAVPPVAGSLQRDALSAVLRCVSADVLRVPDSVRRLIAPWPPGQRTFSADLESFASYTGPLFDPLAAAEAAAASVLHALLHPQRAARLAAQADFDATLPTLNEVLSAVRVSVTSQIYNASESAHTRAVRRVVLGVWVDALTGLLGNSKSSPRVRAIVWDHAANELKPALAALLAQYGGADSETRAHLSLMFARVSALGSLSTVFMPTTSPASDPLPLGPPIG